MTKIEVLQQSSIVGCFLCLPPVQLDRKLYVEVKTALELIGGKWKTGRNNSGGFIFPKDPTELIAELINGGDQNLKKDYQFFPTPDHLCEKMVILASIQPNDTVLEPSAGQGAIIKAINYHHKDSIVDYYELMPTNRMILEKSDLNCNYLGDDFLKHNTSNKYDVIIANPPFTNNQDIDHLRHMYECLNPGGRLVCITSTSWHRGSQKKHLEFKEWLSDSRLNSSVQFLKEGTFKESGTNIETILIYLEKPIQEHDEPNMPNLDSVPLVETKPEKQAKTVVKTKNKQAGKYHQNQLTLF